MFERFSLKLVQFVTELKREEGQGATEYAMVIVFLILILGAGLGFLGGGINSVPRASLRRAGRPDLDMQARRTVKRVSYVSCV